MCSLVLGGVADVLDVVDAPWADERRVEALDVVGGHKQEAVFGRGNAVEGVEEAGKGDVVVHVDLARGDICKRSINVLQQHNALLGDLGERVGQPVVGHPAVVEVENADPVVELSSKGSDKRTLPAPRRAVQEIPPPVGDAPVEVPPGRGEKLVDIVQKRRCHPVVKHHRVERAPAPGVPKGTPLGAPRSVHNRPPLVLLGRQRLRVVEKRVKHRNVRPKRRDLHSLPRRPRRQINHLLLPRPLHQIRPRLVPKVVSPWTRNIRKRRLGRPVGLLRHCSLHRHMLHTPPLCIQPIQHPRIRPILHHTNMSVNCLSVSVCVCVWNVETWIWTYLGCYFERDK